MIPRSRIDEMICRQEGISFLTQKEIERIQFDKLNDLLARVHTRAGFYAHLPDHLSSLDQLANLPFTTDEDLAAHPGQFLLVSQSDIERVLSDATSGTTGRPKRVFYTKQDCRNTIELYKAGLGEFVYPGSKTMICMPFAGAFSLGELIATAIEELGATPLKIGIGSTFTQLQEILQIEKPDTFVGMPSHLSALLTVLGPMSFKRALISGDACPNAITNRIEHILESRLFPHYGSREMGMAGAITCPAHKGMHLRENHIIAEIVDEAGHVLPHGETGELVITTIGAEAMPLIRYRTGDYTRILPGACACQSPTIRLDTLHRKGASGDMLSLDEALFSLDGLVDYRACMSNGQLELEVLGLPELTAEQISDLVPSARVTIRQVTLSDRPLFLGKRTLLHK